MSNDWKVINKESGGTDHVSAGLYVGTGILPLVDILTGNTPTFNNPDKYTVEDSNGNEHTVYAKDADELGEKIANGDFDDDED